MDSRFLKADIQSFQKTRFLSTSCLRKSGVISVLNDTQFIYASFIANKMLFPMTCYMNIFTMAMFSRSSNVTSDLVFLKIWHFNFL
jgi:hypothetical protein